MPMRVIGGEARGRPLRTLKGSETRPTADKVKGAIFSMIESAFFRLGREEGWEGRRVLDLYAGTGALGIEALSRGAARADFVEHASIACAVIADNLRRTGLADRGQVHCLAVAAALARSDVLVGPYDLILLDPPYSDPALTAVVRSVLGGPLVSDTTIVVVEHAKHASLDEEHGKLRRFRLRTHGHTSLSIYGPPELSDAQDDQDVLEQSD